MRVSFSTQKGLCFSLWVFRCFRPEDSSEATFAERVNFFTKLICQHFVLEVSGEKNMNLRQKSSTFPLVEYKILFVFPRPQNGVCVQVSVLYICVCCVRKDSLGLNNNNNSPGKQNMCHYKFYLTSCWKTLAN